MSLIANRPFLPPLIQTHPKVIERGAIRIEWPPVRPNDTDAHRCEVQHLQEFRLLCLQPLFGLLALVDVRQQDFYHWSLSPAADLSASPYRTRRAQELKCNRGQMRVK